MLYRPHDQEKRRKCLRDCRRGELWVSHSIQNMNLRFKHSMVTLRCSHEHSGGYGGLEHITLIDQPPFFPRVMSLNLFQHRVLRRMFSLVPEQSWVHLENSQFFSLCTRVRLLQRDCVPLDTQHELLKYQQCDHLRGGFVPRWSRLEQYPEIKSGSTVAN